MRKRIFKNKKIIVTGAASGLGREISLIMDREGAELILVDKNEKGLEAIKLSLTNAQSFCCDFRNEDHLDKVIDEISSLGQIYGIIHCAGYEVDGFIDDIPLEEFRKNMEVNFYAPLKFSQKLYPSLKDQGDAFIVNVLSDMGKKAVPGRVAYCVSKAALIALSEGLRGELLPYGIDMVMVFPGVMDTKFVDNIEQFGRIQLEHSDPRRRQAPSLVAKKIIKGLKKRKMIISQLTKTKVFLVINFFFPRVGDMLIKRFFRTEKINL